MKEYYNGITNISRQLQRDRTTRNRDNHKPFPVVQKVRVQVEASKIGMSANQTFYLDSHKQVIPSDVVQKIADVLNYAKLLIQKTIIKLAETEELSLEYNYCFHGSEKTDIAKNYSIILNELDKNNLVIEDLKYRKIVGEGTKGYVASPGLPRMIFGSNIHLDLEIDDINILTFALIHEASHAYLNTIDKSYLTNKWSILQEAKQSSEMINIEFNSSFENISRIDTYYPQGDKYKPDINNADSYSLYVFILNKLPIPKI